MDILVILTLTGVFSTLVTVGTVEAKKVYEDYQFKKKFPVEEWYNGT